MVKSERVFVTGCGGMLGEAVHRYLGAKCHNIVFTDRVVIEDWLAELDVRDEARLIHVFKDLKPTLVIHLAAETDLEYCETNVDIAQNTNSIATKTVARLSEEYGSTLVYISTAGVFDGTKRSFYTEQDQPNPIMVYGRTKYEGELHALECCSRAFVIRAGWMVGGGPRKEKKFVYKILKQIEEGKKQLYAVDDKWGTPTYTPDFVANLLALLSTRRYGLYHMVCGGKGTRYDVAKEILRICGRSDIELNRVTSKFFEEEYFAPRPRSEMMRNGNLARLDLDRMRPWRECLRGYIEEYFPDHITRPQAATDAV